MAVANQPKASKKFIDSFAQEFQDYDSSGSNCQFYDLGFGWGIKCYFDKDSFEVSYQVQKYLSKKNLAPKVLESFELNVDGDRVFCFFTEVADGLVGYGSENSHAFADEENYSGVDSEGEFDYDMVYFHCDEREEYNEKFHEVTKHWYMDNHVGNYGWIDRKGERILVSIDFDSCWPSYRELKKMGCIK